jgi:pectate lyase-like protein
MAEHKLALLEADPRFPSGPWTGFYLQHCRPGRRTTNLHLTVVGGRLTGEGADEVGPYTMDGQYDLATGRCEWIKQYVGKHSVSYRGMNDGHGIWGVWEIRVLGGLLNDRGGFHLWPAGSDVSEESERTEQAVLEVMRAELMAGNGHRSRQPALTPGRNIMPRASRFCLLVLCTWLLCCPAPCRAGTAEEFVGPFPSWRDLKRDYGARGDGKADDTAALQQTLADPVTHPTSCVLHIPRGVYRLTRTVKAVRKRHTDCHGVSVAENEVLRCRFIG